MRALKTLLMHPEIPRIQGQIVAAGACADDNHAAPFHHENRNGDGGFARMLEDEVHIVAFAGVLPDRGAEFADFLEPRRIFGRVDFRHLTPALEVLAVHGPI